MVGVHPDGGSTGVGYGAAGAEVETVHAGAQMAPVDPAAVEGEHANPFLTSCTRSAVDWSDVAGERRAQTQTVRVIGQRSRLNDGHQTAEQRKSSGKAARRRHHVTGVDLLVANPQVQNLTFLPILLVDFATVNRGGRQHRCQR